MTAIALRVLGCRGSMAVSGAAYRRYGGNTTCFEVEVEPRHHLIVDCGTGLQGLTRNLPVDGPRQYTILLTHYHWDHIQGLPVFLPLFDEGNEVVVYGPAVGDRGVRQVLGDVIRPPWWPVSFDDNALSVACRPLQPSIQVGSVSVHHARGRHPQGVVAYRLDSPLRSIVIATDHEAGDRDTDARLAGLAAGADVLVHDAQYTPEELASVRRGWGHSSYEGAVRAAQDAETARLVLTSHDPSRDDESIDRLRGVARAAFPNTDAAYEGMTIPL